MAAVRPFFGLRYGSEAGDLDRLTAPPYDVLTPGERDEYAARSPHNVVHLTLPEAKTDDRSKFVRYARSAASLAHWRREGVLVREEKPAIYRYTQQFRTSRNADPVTRTAIIALLKVEPYDRGVVLPHEQTFPKHREDRQRLLEATRAHLETIFGLYEDPDGKVAAAIEAAPGGTVVESRSDDGVFHRLDPITDEASLAAIADLLREKKIWIADGHHRYETALAFRQALGEREGEVPEDYLPVALCSLTDPGLVLMPTHRIVPILGMTTEQALGRLAEHFDLEEHHSSRLSDLLGRARHEGRRAFAVAFEGGRGFMLTPKDDASLTAQVADEPLAALRDLDVTLLHRVILEMTLGVPPTANLSYTRDAAEAIRAADQGAGAAFLMNAPSVDDMKGIALAGGRMPHKSTYYFPKILSGLVFWSLNDF